VGLLFWISVTTLSEVAFIIYILPDLSILDILSTGKKIIHVSIDNKN